MALEFTEEGLISLENREAIFEGGTPVNMPEWGYMKDLPEIVKDGRTHELSERVINETWNPIIDPYTGMLLRSPVEQFKIFCKRNRIDVRQVDKDMFLVKHEIFNWG